MDLFKVYSLWDIDIVRAEGSYVWDDKGTRYLDMYGGHAVISIGHTHPHYVDTVVNQLKHIGFYSNSVIIDQQRELADKLGELSGKRDYQLFLCNSGAEANENALKLASFHNGKSKVIAMKGAFHGRTSLAVAATDNPNIVAPPEMKLLEISIWEDGYTMPCVCYYIPEQDIYELVDGYHRYQVMKTSKRIYEREEGKLPVVVIEKDLSNRMASTIRHNRARGTHNIELMSNIVSELVKAGMSDSWIQKNIGMDKDELLRLKQISGLAELFADKEFSLAKD